MASLSPAGPQAVPAGRQFVPAAEQPTASAPLSWAATLAALTAFATLLATYGPLGGPDSIILLGLMLLLAALRVTGWHLPLSSAAHWALRLALGTVIVFANWDKFNDPQSWLFDTTAVGAFGMLAASEFVVQAARTLPLGPPGTPARSSSGALCLLSGYVFLAACTTDQIWPIRLASPVYFALAVLSLPRFGAERRQDSGGAAGRGLAIVSALTLGACVYTLFWIYRVPLMQLGAGSLRDRPTAEATGLSSQPVLEATFGQPGSLERVLRVQNVGGHVYLRGIAYDTYAQGRWGPAFDTRHLTPYLGGEEKLSAQPEAMQVTTLAPVRGVLFVPLQASRLSFASGAGLAVQQDLGSGGFHLHATVPPPYAVGFGTGGSPPLLRATLSPEERTRDLAVPSDIDPRVLALARQVAQGSATPAAKAAAVQRFFLENFHYSLTIHPGAGDPVSSFVLGRKAAHCEFFASGAVLMLRAVGLPARYVTGYYAHEAEGPGTTLVRQQDAHAWAEVWLTPQGWTTLDATPGDGRPPATAAPVPWTRRATEWMGDRIAALRAWLAQFTTGQILGALAALGALYWGGKQLWRRLRRGPANAQGFAYAQSADMHALARRFELWLRRIGLPCPLAVPWEEHVRTVGLADALPFVQHYNAVRFGLIISPRAVQDLEQALRLLEQTKDAALHTRSTV